MRLLTLALLAVTFVFAAPHNMARAASEAAGKVTTVSGDVYFADVTGTKIRNLQSGDAIYKSQIIDTGTNGHADITFTDGTAITIASKGRLSIDDYVYNTADTSHNKARFKILGLTFAYIGGLLDKGEKPDVTLTLDMGSIGIRGTKLYRTMTNGECWIYLAEGQVDVFNKAGRVSMGAGDGTKISSKTMAPHAPYKFSADEIKIVQAPLGIVSK